MLLFDLMACQPVGGIANHGGKEYGEAVFFELMKRDSHIAGIFNSKEYCNPLFIDYCKSKGGIIDVQQCSLQEAIDSGIYTSFYSALPYSYDYINFGNVKFIGNIHGLRDFEAFTDTFEVLYTTSVYTKIVYLLKQFDFVKKIKINKQKANLRKILDNASFVCLTGSQHSKATIKLNFPRIHEESIHVFCDPLVLTKPTEDYDNPYGKYHLLVSGNRWIKNTARGVLALDELISSGQIDNKVVVTGVVGNLPWVKKIKNKEHFVLKGYVSENELANLFANAYSLVFLSLSEGFGYPPLEAIARGVPVVCSPLTAVYEVYQNGALYCNPFSIDDIKTKILMFEDPDIHKEYIEKGKQRYLELVQMQNNDMEKLINFVLS